MVRAVEWRAALLYRHLGHPASNRTQHRPNLCHPSHPLALTLKNTWTPFLGGNLLPLGFSPSWCSDYPSPLYLDAGPLLAGAGVAVIIPHLYTLMLVPS